MQNEQNMSSIFESSAIYNREQLYNTSTAVYVIIIGGPPGKKI